MSQIAIIGGDKRAECLAALCRTHGHQVTTLGLLEEDEKSGGIRTAEILLFPYPFSVKGETVPNLRNLPIHPAEVLHQAENAQYIVTGSGMELALETVEQQKKQKWRVQKYTDAPLFLQANTDISAEGALSYAMHQLPCALQGTHCLVVGYGLFGQAITQKLQGLGAVVTVAARSEGALAKAKLDGATAVPLWEMQTVASTVRILMNTVPVQVIGDEVLTRLPGNALLMELASAPYGFDLARAQNLGHMVALLPGIPGLYAPETAAQALYDAMMGVMEEKQT